MLQLENYSHKRIKSKLLDERNSSPETASQNLLDILVCFENILLEARKKSKFGSRPIIIIDEIQNISKLMDQEGGEDAIKVFINFLVDISKDKKAAQVIITASDPSALSLFKDFPKFSHCFSYLIVLPLVGKEMEDLQKGIAGKKKLKIDPNKEGHSVKEVLDIIGK